MYQRILAPFDGSATSMRGLEEAIELAKDHKALLRVLHVLDESAIAMDPSGMGVWNSVMKQLREEGEKILREAKACSLERGVEAQTKLVETVQHPVSRRILEEAVAWPADLIVMGTHGRRGMARLILGSDAQDVLHQTTVPVLMVRGSE